jgi:hypothetical protein
MKTQFLVPALCVVLMPLVAVAGDYKRKDYLESYERTYEHRIAPPTAAAKAHGAGPRVDSSSGSHDEYSLYEWTQQKQAESGNSIEPESGDSWLTQFQKYLANIDRIPGETDAQYNARKMDELQMSIDENNRQLEDYNMKHGY